MNELDDFVEYSQSASLRLLALNYFMRDKYNLLGYPCIKVKSWNIVLLKKNDESEK